MDAALFRRFCDLAYQKAGIFLKEGKESLVAARIAKRLRVLGLVDDRQYLNYLEQDNSGDELVQFLDAISTNYTSFLREREHFDFLMDCIKKWISEGQHRIRVWCAASSSGEEPYSLAITILDAAGDQKIDLKILATDISTKVLSQASSGFYDSTRIEPLSALQRERYFIFKEKKANNEKIFEVRPEVKKKIVFKRLNLSQPPFPMSGPLDVIFCRNVMMYFDHRVRQGLVNELERLLSFHGFITIGHAETLNGLTTPLVPFRPSIYCHPRGMGKLSKVPSLTSMTKRNS